MRKTEVWSLYPKWDQDIIRKALKKKAAERTSEEAALLRTYWRRHKRRDRDRLPTIDNHLINPEYRAWLKKQGLPEKFDAKTYYRFRRIHG